MSVCRSLLLLVLSVAACSSDVITLPPVGHVLVHIDTDAPVAPPRGMAPDPEAPPALFDRLQVEVFHAGDVEPCPGCVSEFDLTEDALRAGGGLALVPDAPTSLTVRVRMFLSARRIEGQLAPEATVEVVTRLPEIGSEGGVEALVFMPTDAVGQPLGTLAEPLDAERGPFGASRVGTWPGARRVDCSGDAPAGTVCVPGGAFWMGHPLALSADARSVATRQRLVVLQPFFIDDREATVASFRQTGVSSMWLNAWTGNRTGADLNDWCTYTLQPDPERESLPVACIHWEGARQYCAARGGELPTEAQFEYVAGARESRTYVWGGDNPKCDDAIWSRFQNLQGLPIVCGRSLRPGDIGGPLPLPPDANAESLAPPRARDVVRLPDGDVFDLAGNLAEWTRDHYQSQDEPCWSAAQVFHDPLCDVPGIDAELRVLRGGSWPQLAERLRAASRGGVTTDPVALEGGVRCVFPAAP